MEKKFAIKSYRCTAVSYDCWSRSVAFFFEGIMGLDIPDSGIPIYHTTSFFISRILASVAVPLFFFISGYLFFFRTTFSVDVYKKKLKSRIKTLLIPYLFWNFVVLVGHWIVTVLSPVQLTSGAYKQVSDYTVCDYLISFGILMECR